MKIFELIKATDIEKALSDYQNDLTSSLTKEHYRSIFNNLLSLTPNPQEEQFSMHIEKIENDFDLYLINESELSTDTESDKYSFSFTPWSDLMDLDVFLNNIPKEVFVLYFIYNITFYGSTEEKIQKYLKDLEEEIKDISDN